MIDAQTHYKRKMLAAWLCPLALMIAVWNGGLRPLRRVYSRISADILKMDQELQISRSAYRTATALANEETKLDRQLAPLLAKNVLPENNIYMMLNLKLYDYARQTGLDIRSLQRGFPAAANWMDKPRTGFNFKPFQVVIDASGEFDAICRFYDLVERDNVFSTAAEMALRTRDMKNFDMLLKIDWPVLTEYAREIIVPTIKEL